MFGIGREKEPRDSGEELSEDKKIGVRDIIDNNEGSITEEDAQELLGVLGASASVALGFVGSEEADVIRQTYDEYAEKVRARIVPPLDDGTQPTQG